MESLENQIKEFLECPVCFEIPIAPIFICERGHSLCLRCKLQVSLCPVCKGQLTGIRNICAEKISAKIAKPCEYSFYGCSVVSTDFLKPLHEENCRFRPYKCDLPGSIDLGTHRCNGVLIHPQNVIEHMKSAHNMEGIIMDSMKITCIISKEEMLRKKLVQNRCKSVSRARFLHCYGCLFLCVTTFNAYARCVNLFVCTSKEMMTEEHNENSFSAQVSVSNKNHKLSSLTWNGPVYDSKKSIAEVFFAGGCLSLHYENLLSFCVPSQDQHKCSFQVLFTVVRNR